MFDQRPGGPSSWYPPQPSRSENTMRRDKQYAVVNFGVNFGLKFGVNFGVNFLWIFMSCFDWFLCSKIVVKNPQEIHTIIHTTFQTKIHTEIQTQIHTEFNTWLGLWSLACLASNLPTKAVGVSPRPSSSEAGRTDDTSICALAPPRTRADNFNRICQRVKTVPKMRNPFFQTKKNHSSISGNWVRWVFWNHTTAVVNTWVSSQQLPHFHRNCVFHSMFFTISGW